MTKLYLLDITKLLDKETREKYLLKISPARREKALRLRKEDDIALSIGGALLMEYFTGSKEIMYTKSGKPYCRDMHFNLSHSGKKCIFALSDGSVGVDIEKIRPYNSAVAARCFTKKELHMLSECADRDSAFTAMWTLKESFIKCVGKGLSLPLKEIELAVSGKGVTIIQDFYSEDYRFFRCSIDGYKISACSTDGGFAHPEDLTDILLK